MTMRDGVTKPGSLVDDDENAGGESYNASDAGTTFPSLPCYPCPYNASCCAYGVSLSDSEAAAIESDHGPGLVYRTRWGEFRTRVRQKRCSLYRDGGCTIHDKPYYPAVCRGFPWTDAETGGRYEYDVTICGEFVARPALVELQRGGSVHRRAAELSPDSDGR